MELILEGGARIQCPAELKPAFGQYVLAAPVGFESNLPVPIYAMESTKDGFHAAPPIPREWRPGEMTVMRGPLGHGFNVPAKARRIALAAYDDAPVRFQGLVTKASAHNTEMVILTDVIPSGLPESVEVQPIQAILEVIRWADYLAMDAARENWPALRMILEPEMARLKKIEAQVLIRTAMPCGGMAECGVCALEARGGWRMVCKEGPVFNLKELV